ncbi:uncharacterized protein M421DRAFT_99406 [Didymella exigua CBS 183.55]|uniref:Uncharacterized protein n=1 Tax=Didymella exigua CBS 183.55 TaxID=1150837 RepID=A0A6A5RTE3_9PLEO|nr:uncharacterized protein M421DRAFT_99406 [Didymella exigua CBS 183.55]KAF1930809.1 hypothetical protein M421DRAFT_99406 [Didymella exigua CBS 183.55]
MRSPARPLLVSMSQRLFCFRLCATATVVGASAVGLSFGRGSPLDSSTSDKRKATPAPELAPGPMPATTQTTSATTTAVAPFSAPIPFVPTSRIPIATRMQDGRPQRRPIVRRMTSSDAPMRPPSAVVNGFAVSEHGADESDVGTHVSRRASWMKRLSTISVSQHSSRSHSPAPLSPSVSCPNGSVAFSHDRSAVPMMGRHTPSQLSPNKLVKRSSSVRAPRDTHSAHGSGTSSLRPSFRRPATSHQRSATLQNYHSLLPVTRESPSLEVKPSSASTDSEAEYTQFFTAKSLRGRTLSRRFSPNITRVKRIFPDEKHRATLVLARAVTATAEDLEESASEAGESVFYVSRPGTPLSYTAAVATSKPGAPHFTENTHIRPPTAFSSTVVSEDASRRRRSFSIADLFPTSGSSAKKQRLAKQPGMKHTCGSSQRISSDPIIPTMGKRSNTTQGALPERRNLTDPAPPKRDIFSSTGIAESISHHHGAPGGSSTSPSSTLPPPRCAMTVPGNRLASMPQLEAIASAAPATNQAPPSPSTLAQAGVRPSRHSIAPSEQASTLVGSSDHDVRAVSSVDEDDADFRGETLYDSLRTGARSVSDARGLRIETIFDDSPPAKVKVTALQDLLPSGAFTDDLTNDTSGDHSIAEDDESIITPVRTVRPERFLQEAVSFSRANSTTAFPSLIPSSPPGMSKPLSLGTLEWDSTAGDDDSSSRWSLDEQEGEDPWVDRPLASHLAKPITLRRSNPRLLASVPNSKPTTPQHLALDHVDRDARSSIFDWSEQQPAAQSSGNRTPPRPRTVHGKKDANRRDSRSVGRRAPSGLHTRSQSVPVVPDVVGKRSTVVTNKFGTWGIGSKGVTEDWNDDFDFSELAEEPTPKSVAGSQRIDSGSAMVVPKSIQEQQNNVLANISLLREWGLLIEELKEHKVRAIALGIMDGPQSGMWEEVDAMIDLADQEAEHEEVPQATPPSSPGFDEAAFDDVSGSPNVGRGRRKAGSPNDDLSNTKTVRPRKSILPPNDRIFGPQSPAPPRPKYEAPATPESRPITRPRKDSEAKARSVIEALQTRRSIFESPAPAAPTPSPKKVPFDTATLRRIVPYVSGLTHKVKVTIRDAEGLYYSPTTSPQHEEPPFAMSPFQVDAELTSHMKLMTVM